MLVGEWRADAIADGEVVAHQLVTFEWIEGGVFLAYRTQATVLPHAPAVWHENAPSSSTGVIAADDGSQSFTYSYADSRGVSRVHAMTLDAEGRWTQSGRPGEAFHQRWDATVGPTTIDGRYERSADGRTWNVDFEMRFRRVT